jgi:hypothetical protein
MNTIKAIVLFWVLFLGFSTSAQTYLSGIPQVNFALKKINGVIEKKDQGFKREWKKWTVKTSLDSVKYQKEAYSLSIDQKTILIEGGSYSGIIYGALFLAEILENAQSPQNVKPKTETPKYAFRAIKYDLPWDSYRHSEALDLHVETCKDLNYWEKFLDMMVENRFNVLTLWNLHPYTFMIKPKNFPEASPFTDEELAVWQKLFHGILNMAEERGIDTYLMPFNIFVSAEFAKAHQVALDNLNHYHIGKADTSQIIKTYTKECVTQVLQEYPELDGFGITLGEVVGGMTPAEREKWVHETIYEGMRLSGRKTKLIHRIPFSANLNPGGSTSKETEQITRKILDDDGRLEYLESPIMADLKYNWSHGHSTPKLVKVHGGKLYDTYFKPSPINYKIVWTIRNEDFFCLRWGSTDFIRRHIKENSQDYMGGYMIGSETYIPAKDYFSKNTEGHSFKYAFERQWLFYKTWGRLLYNPETPEAVFENEFIKKYGKQANVLSKAYSLASNTPLTLASFFDLGWDFTLYSEGFMALNLKTRNVEFIDINRLINQATLDPDLISISDFVQAELDKRPVDKNKVTPLDLALKLEKEGNEALSTLSKINSGSDPTLFQEIADAKIWSYLGLYLAEKIRAGVALQRFKKTGNLNEKNAAIKSLNQALSYWQEVIFISEPLYNTMPLVHFSEQKNMSPEAISKLRFHWSLLKNEVLKDIEIAKDAQKE